ncbi:MAG: hypothetical protein GX198_07320 [Epulopiscium sp.]|nr:hypothetical protein [Candidatus Epulonipiscium sp.]
MADSKSYCGGTNTLLFLFFFLLLFNNGGGLFGYESKGQGGFGDFADNSLFFFLIIFLILFGSYGGGVC